MANEENDLTSPTIAKRQNLVQQRMENIQAQAERSTIGKTAPPPKKAVPYEERKPVNVEKPKAQKAARDERLLGNYFDIIDRIRKYGPEGAKSMLEPGEAQELGAAGITEMNQRAAEAQDEVQRRAGLRRFEHLSQANMTRYAQSNGSRDFLPTDLKTQEDKDRFIVANFPTLAKLQREANLTDQQVKDSTNFVLATETARRIVQSVSNQRRDQLFAAIPQQQQALVLDIINAAGEVAKERADLAQQDPNFLQRGLQYLGIPLGAIFDGLMWANEQAVHAVRASVVPRSAAGSWSEAWDQTESGVFDEKGIAWAKETYGEKPVGVILDLRQAQLSGEEDAIGAVIKKYGDANDIESLNIIDRLINRLDGDQELQDLATYIDSLDQGNLGNIASWSLGAMLGKTDGVYSAEGFEWANSAFFTGMSVGTNVAGTFAFDPTRLGAVTMGIYKGARYGLVGLDTSAAGMSQRLDKVFRTRGVRNYFNDVLGPQLRSISEETDIGRKAQMFNSVAAQNRKFFKPEAIAMMERAGVTDAASAFRFFDEGDNIGQIFLGQGAKRGSQVVAPHMTTATTKFKIASMAVRGATWERVGSSRWIDGVFGAGTSEQIAAELRTVNFRQRAGAVTPQEAAAQRAEITRQVQDRLADILSQPGKDREIGEFLSQFVFNDGEAKRTVLGRLIGGVLGDDIQRGTGKIVPWKYALARYGYAKEGKWSARTRLERVSRLMSHRPDTSQGLYIADGRDADVVRQIFLAGGVNPYWSNFAKYLWVHSDEAQRKIAANGIARTFGYATGLHVVDPDLGVSEIGRMGEAVGQRYAADVIDIAELRRTAKNMARQERRTYNAAVANGTAQNIPEPRTAGVIFEDLLGSAQMRNPGQFIDADGSVQNTAVFMGQTSERVQMPDLAKAEQLGIRQSMLQGFLGNNVAIQTLTDYWVLGTLLGPRFQMRSGIEDFGLYVGTGGSLTGFRQGRILSQAIREATGQKLGIVKTTSRYIGDAGEDLVGATRSFILPHLDKDAVKAAHTAFEAGERMPLVNLIKEATLRRRLIWATELEKRGLAYPAKVLKPSAKQKRYNQYISDLVKYSDNPLDSMGQVSETSAHLIDGTMPRARHSGVEVGTRYSVFIGGEPHQITKANGGFDSRLWSSYNGFDDLGMAAAHDDWLDSIILAVVKDGEKGKNAVRLVRDYYRAINAANVNRGRVNAIIDELAGVIDQADLPYNIRLAHGAREGSRGLAQRTLDSVLSMFVDDTNRFNDDLYNALVRTMPDGSVSVRLTDNGVPRVTVESLKEMPVKPMAVLTQKGVAVAVPNEMQFRQWAWEATGRSLARLTREPIFLSNYLDARELIAPFERQMAERFGRSYARRWAVDLAERRAVEVSLSYVDNPAVRSQLAWNVRNIARFYRALEDFNRRMVRTMKNQPVTFWKIALAWNVLDDSGFVHEDEFGEKYFVWPGVNVAFNVLNDFTTWAFDREMLAPNAGMTFTSNVNMLTPSADPNSWTPTFSGPFAAFAIAPIMKKLPGLSSLQTTLFGEYSENQDWFRTVLPPNMTRIMDLVLASAQSPEDRESLAGVPFATFYRQASQLYTAANPGWQQQDLSDVNKISEARKAVDGLAMDLLFFKFATGMLLPAATYSQPDLVTPFARSLGLDGLRETFVQLQSQYADEPDGMTKAWLAWYKMNPNLSPFTLSSTYAGKDVTYIPLFKETGDFINKYGEEFKGNMLGFSHFMPQTGTDEQGLATWNQLVRMGAREPKNVKEIFDEMVTQQGYVEYMILESQYDAAVAAGDPGADDKRKRYKRDLQIRFPLLDSRINGELSNNNPVSKGDYERKIESIREAARFFEGKGDARAKRYLDALSVYDSFLTVEQLDPVSARYKETVATYKENWKKRFIPRMLREYGDDKQFKSFLYMLSKRLGTEVDING